VGGRTPAKRTTPGCSQDPRVATIHSARLDATKEFDRELHSRLRDPFDELLLESRLDDNEIQAAQEYNPGLANDHDLERLPELFAAVLQLIDRYQQSRAEQPVGVAVAAAAIAWQRAGMPPGSIDYQSLLALTKLTLHEIKPALEVTDEEFRAGLNWSMEPVATYAALVRKSDAVENERYRAFDAVVSWAAAHERPLSQAIWDLVLEHADERNLNALAMTAYDAQQLAVTERAWVTAIDSVDRQVSSVATFNLGVLLQELERFDEAKVVYRSALESSDPDVAPLADKVLKELREQGK
jgi:tetratricopeptide (TPR) repeat protein